MAAVTKNVGQNRNTSHSDHTEKISNSGAASGMPAADGLRSISAETKFGAN
jgi:hypothetical protein